MSLFAHPESGFDLSNVEWTLPDGSKRYGSTLNLGAFSNNLLGEYSVTGTTTQCGVIDHPFVIKLNTVEANEYASFCEGDTFTWPNHFMPDGITPMTFSSEGTYRDTITSVSGSDSICILHLTSTPLPDMAIRPDTTIMPGDSAILWAKGVDFCRWTPENSLSKTDELKIYARPTATTTYTATGYSILSSSQNVVYNGGFEDGNTGFNSNLNYITPYTITGGCGDYTITDNVKGFWMRYSHSSTAYSGANMMIIDGATSPNSIIWQQNVQVEPHTYYAFSAQVMSCLTSNSYGQYALLQFSVNGSQLGPIFHSPSKLYNWTQYYQIWYSGNNTTATLTILNQNNSGNGNDFAIDEIRFDALSYSCETIKQVTIHVAGQTIESNENASFCEGDSFTWPNHFMPDGVTPMTFSSEGIYRDTITSASGSDSICILHLTSMPLPDMTIRPDTTIMPGDSAILWAKGVDFCRWTPENSLSKTSDNLIYAHPSQTTTYTARGYSLLSVGGNNLVYNGDFEQGNVGFNTSLNYFAPNTYHQGYGSYSISNDIIGFWKNQQESVKAYGGSGNMMIVDGSTTPNAIVWSQQVAVEPNTYYAFSAQVMSCFASHMHGQYALLQFSINGTQLGPILHSPNVLHAWTQYYEIWYSGNNTTATLTVLNQNNDGLGNDFALDNIRLDALSYSCEAIKQVIINVRGQDTDSTEIASICAGDTYTWHDKQFNTTTTTITETIPNSVGGDSVCTLLLTVLEPSDSIEIATICAGKTYTWHGQTFSTSTTQTETLTNAVGCDSVCTLQLTVLPPITTDISASITEGASFTWNGQTYTVAGDYPSSFTTDEGCDSVVTLHLTVNPLTYEIQTHTQCADDPFVEFDVTADASLFHQLQFTFAPNALNQHFRDTIVDFTNSLIQIPNSARAGIYDVAISTLLDNQVLDTRSYQFTLLYPSSVLDQHWDDFIGVLTHDYNGEYDFSGFQWYKDGTPIPGENHSYLYQPLEMGAAYSAMLEEADGTKLMTCDLIAVPQTEIALYPTLVQSQQIVQLHSTAEVIILLYNSFGTLVYNHSFAPGDHLFAAPVEKGVYIIKIQQTDEQGQSATKKLLVR